MTQATITLLEPCPHHPLNTHAQLDPTTRQLTCDTCHHPLHTLIA